MNPWSIARAEQISDHLSCLVDPEVPDGVVIVLQRVDKVLDLLGDLELAQLDDVAEGVEGLDGHDAGDDGAVDADGAAVVHKLLEGGGFEEELSDDEVCPRLHLLLQVDQVVLVVAFNNFDIDVCRYIIFTISGEAYSLLKPLVLSHCTVLLYYKWEFYHIRTLFEPFSKYCEY